MHFKTTLVTAVLLFASTVLGMPAPQAETLCEWKYSSSKPMGTQELHDFIHTDRHHGLCEILFLIDYFSRFINQRPRFPAMYCN